MPIFYMNPILIAAAVIPAVILLVRVNRADKTEKEPPGLLVSLVLYGIIATFLAIAAERLGTLLLSSFVSPDSVWYNVLLYFVVVGLSEEGCKYLLLRARTWNNPNFNYTFDAVVYAVFVSLGFALWENISYVAMYGLSTALVRAVTAVPGHACFGVFMGMWYGFAKKHQAHGAYGKSKACRRAAFLMPAFLHGCYDFAASMETAGFMWIFIAFVILMFISALRLVKKLSANDENLDGGRGGIFWL